MLPGLERIKSHRVWFVPNLVVWGLAGSAEIHFLAAERVGDDTAVLFNAVDVGDAAQSVSFSNLADHRGNGLPTLIAAPKIIIRTKSAHGAYVVGEESAEGFKIARDPNAAEPVAVDLLIIELGD